MQASAFWARAEFDCVAHVRYHDDASTQDDVKISIFVQAQILQKVYASVLQKERNKLTWEF